MSSFTFFTGSAELTARKSGVETAWITGTKSLSGSYGRLGRSAGLMAQCPVSATNTVWPSGDAAFTASAAMMPLAPGLLSTMTAWPTRSASLPASRRDITSGAPPEPYGTTRRRVFAVCAPALAAIAKQNTATNHFFIVPPRLFSGCRVPRARADHETGKALLEHMGDPPGRAAEGVKPCRRAFGQAEGAAQEDQAAFHARH